MMNLRADSFVFIVDGEEKVRQELSGIFEAEGLRVQAFASGEEFLASHDRALIGCVVIEQHLPEKSGLDVLHLLAVAGPQRPVIFHTSQESLELAVEAFRAGASDFILKSDSQQSLVKAVLRAVKSDLGQRQNYLRSSEIKDRLSRLTAAEMEVVKLLSEGMLNKQIAARLNVAVRTIELRRANIFRKMEVASLGDLLRMVIFEEIYTLCFPSK